ncbi:MAG: TetR/AcrR family transcriptional regulator [Actinobacteria bacterium]|nr:MAG: TetR/AcrR family transcriptional regulator [Actinomycetota bacterium]
MSATAPRHTAAERRESILDAALIEFAQRGLEGTSTENIAKRAGISQPYLFRLFGTKKELFKATISRCFRETLEVFQRAAEGKRGEEALKAMGDAYVENLLSDRTRLRAQMQAYAACDDPEICELVRNGYGDLVAYVERVSGLPPEEISRFFSIGMLLNVFASMNLMERPEPWSERLLGGCKPE